MNTKKILEHGPSKLKPPKRSPKRKSPKRTDARPTNDYQSQYDPIDHPFVPPKSPQNAPQTTPDVSKYDPINRPFTPVKSQTTPSAPRSSTQKHPLIYGAILIALLLPFIALVFHVVDPIREIFRDFQEFRSSLEGDPSLTEQELIDRLNDFFQKRQNH